MSMRLKDVKPGMPFYLDYDSDSSRYVYLAMGAYENGVLPIWWKEYSAATKGIYDWHVERHFQDVDRHLVLCGHTPETLVRWIRYLKETGVEA